VPAGRLQVDEQRHAGPGPVEVVQRQVDPEPPGDGEQVHDRVLHGARSEAVLAIAMCGRPSKACAGSPRRIQAR